MTSNGPGGAPTSDAARVAAYGRDPGLAAAALAVVAIALVPVLALPEAIAGPASMAVILSGIAALGRWRGLGWRVVGLGRPASWRVTVATAVGYWALLYPVLYLLVMPLLEAATGVERDLSRFSYLDGNLPALLRTLPSLWLMAGFFEELFFRGLLIGTVVRIVGDRPAGWTSGVVLSAVAFGAAHGYQALSGMLFTALGGAIFGGLFARHRHDLWVLILLHALIDSTSAIRMFLGWM